MTNEDKFRKFTFANGFGMTVTRISGSGSANTINLHRVVLTFPDGKTSQHNYMPEAKVQHWVKEMRKAGDNPQGVWQQ